VRSLGGSAGAHRRTRMSGSSTSSSRSIAPLIAHQGDGVLRATVDIEKMCRLMITPSGTRPRLQAYRHVQRIEVDEDDGDDLAKAS